ncbi:GLTT repeat-containing protein [Myxococcus fulvus]|uniref:GLTT repeat-containing protein n=1 Tax=Myxococcus fulvus TaxID=33 RepID=A0A511T944_MYXFU|nr:hypothetical protein [Myxococcus fulvus]AKF84113.1 hypothetical protein MFUL124B02_40360 [Myxococcus fulvus 124B02]GEN10701.1 hypothetical protein MFU01_57380 [Myxococcus fulvus]SEU37820.1 GLTT repeat-containing protein [Myxococcus fulvus]
MRLSFIRSQSRGFSSRLVRAWALPALLAGAVGCGPEGLGGVDPSESVATHEDGLVSTNGLSTNGLSTNGLSTNGLSTNGLSTNGLSTNGLSTNGLFNTWFSSNPAAGDQLMRYVARCALSSSQTLTYTHNGTTYAWPGSLGLAPTWSTTNQPASVAEQQVVSACLAAHANKFGVHVNISVQGRGATNVSIPTTTEEVQTYSQKEACFFGNLFNNEGLFAANDANYLAYDQSTVRTCGLSSWSGDTACAPTIQHVGSCLDHCQLDATRTHYSRCTYNGVEYKPLVTRIRPQDIYRCGDGVCQVSEKCGTGVTPDSCKADCGTCQ